jgi:choline dehydrogenase-like flavoprotein
MNERLRARAVAALVATFAPPQADRTTVLAFVHDALARLPGRKRARLAGIFAALDALGFARWPLGAREAFLRALADAPVPALRTAFQVFKRLVLFAAYAATDEADRNPLWPAIGYPGPRADRPSPPPLPGSRQTHAGRLAADAVVIGSGAGGGVAAAELTRAGLRVIVLEAGPAAEPIAARQLEARAVAALYLESGLAASEDLGISILAGACVGGGTAVNWSTMLPLAPDVRDEWSAACGDPALEIALAAGYAAVGERLAIQPLRAHNANNAVIVDGARALGWPAQAQARNAGACGPGGGYCGYGCAYGCKRSTAATYLRDAIGAGAELYAGVRAERVRIEGGRVTGVDAGDLQIDAPLVVVAAGALRTPGLLARSGIRSPHLGRHLRLHPTTALACEFDRPIESWHGAMQTALVDRFRDLDGAYGATIEVAPGHPGMMASAFPWRSRARHFAHLRNARNLATLIVLTRDRGEGSVALDGSNGIGYRLAAFDGAHLLTALAGAAALAFAAGAQRVTSLHADPVTADPAELARFARGIQRRGFGPNRLGLFSAHQMGTARMHADPARGVVDTRGRVHGVDGLSVADASVFPLASGVNPMYTIMALARHVALSAGAR